MARKVIGPTGSRRRRWLFLLCLVVTVGAGVFFIPGALAVHDTGAFQLDGDASSATQPIGATAPDDWDHVCHQVLSGNCNTSSDTTGATAVSWTADCPVGQTGENCGDLSATIFTGGGSKDPQNIDQWAWKDGAGGLPDKDNLLHGFAAQYSLTGTNSAGTCPNGTDLNGGTFDSSVPCDVLFFGSDRYDNSGDAQQGFWFFQNKIGFGTNSVGGGTGFSGLHRNNDVLVISDFSIGGTTSTITVYKWDSTCTKGVTKPVPGDCSDINLRLLSTSTDAKCTNDLQQNDNACGIVNPGTITMPWSFTDKSGTASNGALNGEFYEGGINLSTLGLAGECFSSVASESRSSTSTTATLKDFILGQFAPCGLTFSTTPSADTTTNKVSPGTPVTDTATATGTGISSPPYPSSTTNKVHFYLCGPLTTASGCSSTSNEIGTGENFTNTATQGKSTATSQQVNTSGTPLTPGIYCFLAVWAGDTNYTDGPYSDGASTECFTVRTISTSTTSTPWSASDSSGSALVSPLDLGTTLYDKAVVTGTTVGGNPPGSVNFYLCDPSQVTGAAGSEVCAKPNGSALSGNPRTLVADSGSAPPTSTVYSSPGVAANKAGVWCFRAEYVHSGSTYEDSSDATHGECVTVSPADTTTVTSPQDSSGTDLTGAVAVGTQVKDHAVVTGSSADGTPTGTVSFWLCNPGQVTGSGASAHCAAGNGSADSGNGYTVSAIGGSSPPKSEATSGLFTANAVGTWCFRATYTPGGANGANYNGSSDNTNDECFTVTDATSMASTQSWVPNDSATVTATGGTALNGTLEIKMYLGACNAEQTDVAAGASLQNTWSKTLTDATLAADRTLTTSNSTTVSKGTTVAWLVKFTSSDTNVSSSQHCEYSSWTGTD